MTVLQHDSFDVYTSGADMASLGQWANAAGAHTIETSILKDGRASIASISGTGNRATYTLSSAQSGVVYIGLWVRFDWFNTVDEPFLRIGSTGLGEASSLFYITSAGKIKALDGFSGAVGTGTTSLSTGTWYFLLVKWRHASSTSSGDCEVYINGNLEFSAAAHNFFVTDITSVTLLGGGAGSQKFFKDSLRVWNTSGSTWNGLMSAFRFDPCAPDADGNYTAWTRSSGSNNFSLVNESTHDDNTSYLESSTANQKASWTVGDISSNNSIQGITANIIAECTTGTATTMRQILRIGGTDYNGVTHTLTNGTYKIFRTHWDVNPATSAAWAKSAINALEQGIELLTGGTARVTRAWVDVVRNDASSIRRPKTYVSGAYNATPAKVYASGSWQEAPGKVYVSGSYQ